MLSGLRQGAPLFILYKNDLKTAIGEVVSVTPYVPGPGDPVTAFAQGGFQRLYNISATVNGQNVLFKRINGDSPIADQLGEGVLISETRDGILNELSAMRSNSARALEQVETHKRIVSECDRLSLELNPQLKREQEQAREIASLRSDLAELKALFVSSMNSKKEKE